MPKTIRKLACFTWNKLHATNLCCAFCSSQLILSRIGLFKNKQSIHLKQRSGILNQYIRLSHCTSKHI